MRYIILIILLLSSRAGSGQRATRPEKWWAITHPFVACKALKISRIAMEESKRMEADSVLDGDGLGGQVDAFRHAFWMALLSQHMSAKKALSLGRAHEKGNYLAFRKHQADDEGTVADSIMSAMDLYNNERGVEIGLAMAGIDTAALKRLVIAAIQEGAMKCVKKDMAGNWLDCDGKMLNISLYLHRWFIPKCLVSSHRKR